MIENDTTVGELFCTNPQKKTHAETLNCSAQNSRTILDDVTESGFVEQHGHPLGPPLADVAVTKRCQLVLSYHMLP